MMTTDNEAMNTLPSPPPEVKPRRVYILPHALVYEGEGFHEVRNLQVSEAEYLSAYLNPRSIAGIPIIVKES